jgi:3-deoxy-7-phosphoheptulonate synthase
VVARIYTTKPRSNGLGYKGLCFGEDGDDIAKGILACRQMMIDCLKVGLPVADELLYPELYQYFDDLISYSFVGARSSEDSLHRAFASGLDVCCGVKNSTDGDVEKLMQSLHAISLPTIFPCFGNQVQTSGCKFAHVVLRGGALEGKYLSNIDKDSVAKLKNGLQTLGLNDFVMADLSHAKSQKVAQNQIDNAKMAILDENINGIMMESYLSDGSDGDTYGVSKTDQCLGFEDTKDLLLMLNEQFAKR